MSDALRWPRMTRGAGIALALFLGMAAQAEARGIVADANSFNALPTPIGNTCTIAVSCGTFVSFAGTKFYIYTDGLISIGNPIQSSSSFGNYIAAGLLFNYGTSGVSLNNVSKVTYADNSKLILLWDFEGPVNSTPQEGVFEIELFSNDTATIAYGVKNAIQGNWGQPYVKAYCDATCDGSDGNSPDGDLGAFLPTNAMIGSNYPILASDGSTITSPVAADPNLTYGVNFADTTSVPEPSTWAVMTFGLLSLGLLVRLGRKRGRPAA